MNAVLVAKDDQSVVDESLLNALRAMAVAAPLKRARLCLHRHNEDPIHEMVIAFTRDSYIRPHRHHGKSESYHLLEGTLQVILFDDDQSITRRILLGAPGSGRPALFRMSNDVWHTVLIESESVILHETTNGPFVPSQTEFADWAPDVAQAADAAEFMNRLRTQALETIVPGAMAQSLPVSSDGPDAPAAGGAPARPTLTAIICNYNHGTYIGRAIEATLSQTRRADEFIIVDDGSTDDSVKVIESWVARFPSIRFLPNDRNRGFHASLQKALAAATGDYVYSGAADDRVLPEFFDGAMRLVESHPLAGVVSGQFVSVDPSGRALKTHQLSRIHEPGYLAPGVYLRDVLQVEPATHSLSCATIFKRQALAEVDGFAADLGSWGDTFAIQAIGLRYGVCYWPHPAMEWTVMPGSMSQSTRSNPVAKLRLVDRAVERMRSDPFRTLFPEEYVVQWSQGFRQAIVHEQLEPIIEANQVVQTGCRAIAAEANGPRRWLLESLRLVMRGLYFVAFRLMRSVVRRRVERLRETDKDVAETSGKSAV